MSALKEIIVFYKEVKKQRNIKEYFIDPFSKKETQNYIGIPVVLLNKLLKENSK